MIQADVNVNENRIDQSKYEFSKSVLKIRISDVNTVQNTKNKNHYFQFVVRIPYWLERLAAPNCSKQRIICTAIWKYDLINCDHFLLCMSPHELPVIAYSFCFTGLQLNQILLSICLHILSTFVRPFNCINKGFITIRICVVTQ